MLAPTSNPVLTATRRWLKPAIHVLLLCGVTWSEFCALAKALYVEVATAKFGKRNRPTNVSRTAMLTGLTRRDVRRLRERIATADPDFPSMSKASQILSRWHLDPEFQDSRGHPRALPLEAKSGPSFSELLRRAGTGDLPQTTLIRELVAAKAIQQRDDGRFEALQRNFIPGITDEQLIRLWGTVLADVANTYVHNLTRSPRASTRFERAAKNERIPVALAPAFREFLEREGQAFLERVDTWLVEHEATPDDLDDPDTPTTRMGAGVYQIHD